MTDPGAAGTGGSGLARQQPEHLHRTLVRQLRRFGLDTGCAPPLAAWSSLLRTVGVTYAEADGDRYTLERSIEVSSQEMRGLHEVLSRQAHQDALTGLPNRAALVRLLERALVGCSDGRQTLGLLFVDLDGFKMVNDSLGHAAGDELLVRAGERIRACLRPRDVVARLGGDEFVALCPDTCDPQQLQEIAVRVNQQLEAPFRIGEQDAVVSASIGIALTTDGQETAEDLLRRADMAMYAAKVAGKGRSAVFDASMQSTVDTRLSIRSALGKAIARHELRVHYQRIVSLKDHQILGVEALVRWERPGIGLVPPDEFIPVAEESHLIAAVDSWVLQEACRRGAPWCAAGGRLCVNLSARSLEHDEIVPALSNALHSARIAPARLTLELTETSLRADRASVVRNLASLRRLGVQLAIDDFGTGWSSLSQLRSTSVDVLKIDRSFVAVMDEDMTTSAIVAAIISMGHALGLTVVAEGVERQTQEDLLRAQGCDAAQGWLYGRAQSAEEIDDLYGLAPATVSGSAAERADRTEVGHGAADGGCLT